MKLPYDLVRTGGGNFGSMRDPLFFHRTEASISAEITVIPWMGIKDVIGNTRSGLLDALPRSQ
jgi:hypothetical protein